MPVEARPCCYPWRGGTGSHGLRYKNARDPRKGSDLNAVITPGFDVVYDYARVPTLRKLLEDTHRVIGVMGPFGSGKSSGCLMKLMHEAMLVPPMPDGISRCRIPVVRNCFDDQTEILTENGWRLFRDLKTEKVAQLSNDGYLEFVAPTFYYQADYIGEMIGFENEGLDFLVTPDHRLNVSLRNARKKEWSKYRFRTAAECYGKQNMRIKRNAEWIGETDKSPGLFEWLGFWFAEGTSGVYSCKDGCTRHQCVVTQKNNLDYVRQLFTKAHLPYTETKRQDGAKTFRLSVTPTTVFLIQELAKCGKSTTKRVPRWIKNAPREHLLRFLLGYENGDGAHAKNGTRVLLTSSSGLADDIQEIALRAGLSANIRKKAEAGAIYCINGISGFSSAPHYAVTLSTKTEPLLLVGGYAKKYRGWYKQHYVGKVYCVEVPTHRVYIRRNGVGHWSSQTYGELEDTTIRTVHEWLPPHLFGDWKKTEHNYKILAFDGFEIEFMFRALDRPDHVAKLLSLDASFAWVNEAKEIPWSIVEALLLRLGRYPKAEHVRLRWPGLVMDTNPPDEQSEWYRYFEEKKPRNARIYRQPPGLLVRKAATGGYDILGTNPRAENLKSLMANYYVDGAEGKSSEFIKVFLLGEYGFSHDGMAVFNDYNDNTHYRDGLGAHPTAAMWRGWDFGVATSACSFGQVLPGPRLALLGEVVARGVISTGNFADEVLRYTHEKFPGIKEWHDIGDPSGDNTNPITSERPQERSNFAILRGKGIHIQPGSNDLTLRLESMRLGLNTLVGGIPALLLGPGCPTLRKGFLGGYYYRRKRTNATQYEELPYKNVYSHPMDGAEYIAAKIFGGALRLPRNYKPDNRPLGLRPDEEVF